MSVIIPRMTWCPVHTEAGETPRRVIAEMGWEEVKPEQTYGLLKPLEEGLDCEVSAFVCIDSTLKTTNDIIFSENMRHSTGAVLHLGLNVKKEDGLTGTYKYPTMVHYNAEDEFYETGDEWLLTENNPFDTHEEWTLHEDDAFDTDDGTDGEPAEEDKHFMERIAVDLITLPKKYNMIWFVLVIPHGLARGMHLGRVKNLYIRLYDAETGEEICRFNPAENYNQVTSYVFARLYRNKKNNKEWEFQAIDWANQFKDLATLARGFMHKFLI